MSRTVLALYDTLEEARAAVRGLVDNEFDRDQISIVARDKEEAFAEYGEEPTPVEEVVDGMNTGAFLGGLTGLIVGLFALVIPGVGPVIAAGPVAAALAGTGTGIIIGSLVGVLADLGIDEEEAHYYAEGIRRGGVLVAVSTSEALADDAAAILDTYNPVDLEAQAAEWDKE